MDAVRDATRRDARRETRARGDDDSTPTDDDRIGARTDARRRAARGRTRATTRPWTRERSTRADATRGDGEEETKTMRRLERLFD